MTAVDFSDGSRVALTAAARSAVQFGAALHVLHVEDPLLSAAAAHGGFDLSAETMDELRRFVASTPPTSRGEPRLHAAAGAAAAVILQTAAAVGADLVVLGRSGMSGVERVVFGSTAQNVLRRAAVSLLVVPPHWTPPRADGETLSGTGPVIAAIEVTPSAGRTISAGAELAASLGTSLELVHIVAEPRLLARWQSRADAKLQEAIEQARRTLTELAGRAASAVEITVKVESGDVPERLAAAAAGAADGRPLLVLGRRDPASGSAPGATADRVIALAESLVLVHG